MSTIEIENLGPVQKLSIPIPDGGGIVVLKGVNGAGKSETLKAIDALQGKGTVSVRDGSLRGTIEGFGAKLAIAKRTSRSGEIEVESIDSRLSVADVVDPGIKDPLAADSRRIKALVQLAGSEPSVELFAGLLEDGVSQHLSPETVDAADVVTMADKVKRDLEAVARVEEAAAKDHVQRAMVAEQAAGDAPETGEVDEAKLQEEFTAATKEAANLQSRLESCREVEEQEKEAREALAAAEKEYTGPTVGQAEDAACEAINARNKADAKVEELEAALKSAIEEASQAAYAANNACHAAESTRQHFATITKWREQIGGDRQAPPTAEAIQASFDRTEAARKAIEAAAVSREAAKHRERATEERAAEAARRKEADRFRAAAKGTDGVLSELVAKTGTSLRVEDNRLVMDTAKRGATYFAELSAGERWKIALDVAIDALGEAVDDSGRRGILALKQEAWEGLDPVARQAISDHVVSRGVVLLTAECSADEQVVASSL